MEAKIKNANKIIQIIGYIIPFSNAILKQIIRLNALDAAENICFYFRADLF